MRKKSVKKRHILSVIRMVLTFLLSLTTRKRYLIHFFYKSYNTYDAVNAACEMNVSMSKITRYHETNGRGVV